MRGRKRRVASLHHDGMGISPRRIQGQHAAFPPPGGCVSTLKADDRERHRSATQPLQQANGCGGISRLPQPLKIRGIHAHGPSSYRNPCRSLRLQHPRAVHVERHRSCRPAGPDPNSLVISSSTYDRSQGAVASLAVGTPLAGTATATASATASNDYVHVWSNESVDASFGVTSAIQLTDIEPHSGHVFHTRSVPADQVVTSFPSKSELGLHIMNDSNGSHLVFVGYAGSGVGALDVSNSDAVPGQDPTNPVTFAFGSAYAFPRTIVSMDVHGHFAYTPTINYGGNNGRSALLGSNGLYYTVGNANNGNATAFGAANGTQPDVTETTGLEVVTPIDALTSNVAIPANNSAEVDPLIQYQFGTSKPDKPGKDNNYRGVTEYGGALYFTKGSGSNGIDTVYTVSSLPTVASAASAKISIVPGFPTDSAKSTSGNFTPFAVFFANDTTMYVTDEGTGNGFDQTSHAGLEKWSLVDGVWQLDYVLADERFLELAHGRHQPERQRRRVVRRDHDRPAQPDGRRSREQGHAVRDDVDVERLGRQRRRPEQGRGDHRLARGHDDDGRGGEGIVQRRHGTDLRHGVPRRCLRELNDGKRWLRGERVGQSDRGHARSRRRQGDRSAVQPGRPQKRGRPG